MTVYSMGVDDQRLLRRVGSMDQLAGIALVEALDGLGRGNRIFQVWTGTGLSFQVMADRAMDISVCRYKGMSLAWLSSVGEASPSHYEPEGLGWLRTFPGGLLATCGLDQFGAPSDDAGEPLGLHGRVSNLPAHAIGHRAYWSAGEGSERQYELEITGEVRQTRVFGENLVLRRRISSRLGSNAIQIQDTVTNEGFTPHPHMILYHFNLGFPLVSEDATLRLESMESIARDADAEAGFAEWKQLQAPTPGYREQVFRHVPVADDAGIASAEVANLSLGLGLRISYDSSHLPYLFQWKMMGEGMYVLGIEPANCGVIQGRAIARDQGVLPLLAPGESRDYALRVEVIEYPREA
jgi:hypothetical protein